MCSFERIRRLSADDGLVHNHKMFSYNFLGNLSKPGHRDEDTFKTPGQGISLVLTATHRTSGEGRPIPQAVQLGPNRVGWVESEVLEWLEQRLAQREVLN